MKTANRISTEVAESARTTCQASTKEPTCAVRLKDHRRVHSASREAGVAILGALVVVAAVASMASGLLEQQTVDAKALEVERDRAQAAWVLRAGVDWARMVLLNDGRQNAVTRSNGPWAQPLVGLSIELPGHANAALFSGHIEDEQGKFNLMRLVRANAIEPAEQARLATLLGRLSLPADLATHIAQKLLSYQHHAGSGNHTDQRIYVRSVQDLVTASLTKTQMRTLITHTTLIAPDASLNINTASATVLSVMIDGLSPGQAREIVEQRDQGQWFTSVGDLLNRLNLSEQTGSQQRIHQQLGINSHWFMAFGSATLDHAQRGMQALLYRPAGGMPVISWVKDR